MPKQFLRLLGLVFGVLFGVCLGFGFGFSESIVVGILEDT